MPWWQSSDPSPSQPIRLPSSRPPPSPTNHSTPKQPATPQPPRPTRSILPKDPRSLPRLKQAPKSSSPHAPVIRQKQLPHTPPRQRRDLGHGRSPRPLSFPARQVGGGVMGGSPRSVSEGKGMVSVGKVEWKTSEGGKVSEGRKESEGRKVSAGKSGNGERKPSGERKLSSERALGLRHVRKISSEGLRKVAERLRIVSEKTIVEAPEAPRDSTPGLLRLPQDVLDLVVHHLERRDKCCLALACRQLYKSVKVPQYRRSLRHSWHSAGHGTSNGNPVASPHSQLSFYDEEDISVDLIDYYINKSPDAKRRPETVYYDSDPGPPIETPLHLSAAGVDGLVAKVANVPIDQQFNEAMFLWQPSTFRHTLSQFSEVETWCASILQLYHNLDPYTASEKHTLRFRTVVGSEEFDTWFNKLKYWASDDKIPTPLPSPLIPAFRALCHLKVLCGYQRLSGRSGDTNNDLSTLSAVPPIDLDGRVAWEEIDQVQGMIYSLASHHLPADDWVLARPALNKVARPRRQIPSASRDWGHIDGEWYAVIAGWPSDSPSILTVMRNIKVHSDSARNSAKMRKLHLKHGTGNDSSFDSDLPRSEALPTQHFEGSLDSGAGIYLQGVARLTTDTPPEIRYSMLIWDEGVLRLRFEGVQIGGFSSKQGVMGVAYETVACEDVGVKRVAYPAWLFKPSK